MHTYEHTRTCSYIRTALAAGQETGKGRPRQWLHRVPWGGPSPAALCFQAATAVWVPAAPLPQHFSPLLPDGPRPASQAAGAGTGLGPGPATLAWCTCSPALGMKPSTAPTQTPAEPCTRGPAAPPAPAPSSGARQGWEAAAVARPRQPPGPERAWLRTPLRGQIGTGEIPRFVDPHRSVSPATEQG